MKKVSIPYRQGTTTAFTPFVIAIIHRTPHFCNVFLKKAWQAAKRIANIRFDLEQASPLFQL